MAHYSAGELASAMPDSCGACTTCARSGTPAMAEVPERTHVVQVLPLYGIAGREDLHTSRANHGKQSNIIKHTRI